MTSKKQQLTVDVKHCDLPDDMRKLAIETSLIAVSSHRSHMASYIKKCFDKRFPGPRWHCIVGRAYGSYITHDANRFIYLQVDKEIILLFSSG